MVIRKVSARRRDVNDVLLAFHLAGPAWVDAQKLLDRMFKPLESLLIACNLRHDHFAFRRNALRRSRAGVAA
jgi:hypothetical protein